MPDKHDGHPYTNKFTINLPSAIYKDSIYINIIYYVYTSNEQVHALNCTIPATITITVNHYVPNIMNIMNIIDMACL